MHNNHIRNSVWNHEKNTGKVDTIVFVFFLASLVIFVLSIMHRIMRNTIKTEASVQIDENAELQDVDVKFTAVPPIVTEIDFQRSFDGVQGTVVFYNAGRNQYFIHNPKLSIVRASPCDTFKIVSTLMGLDAGIDSSEASEVAIMFKNTAWNRNLTLQEAFRISCTWYFKELHDKLGADFTQEILDELKYGNRNISQWQGGGNQGTEEPNGFWMDSTLKISPEEQVVLLSRLFEEETVLPKEDIRMMKDLMEKESVAGSYTLYGVTGEGLNNAWYIGIVEVFNNTWYFAIRLADHSREELAGDMAKDIVKDILDRNKEIFY